MSVTVPVLRRLDALERLLAAKGFPAMSPWWRSTVERFYRAAKRTLVLRVGRRGGKSSTLCRIAVLEALYGEHVVPPGDVGVVAMISVSRDEASSRLRTIKSILDALGVKYRPCDGGIELEGRPVVFKVYAASVSGVSGFTCICAICDEVAKWRDADSGSNPATEVLASLRPTMATQPKAKLFMSSSPLGRKDAHHAAFERGETEQQCVATAPTWLANPSVTEEETHELEPDARVHAREYGAQPQADALDAFDPEAIARAFLPRCDVGKPGGRILVLDPSSGKKDTWSYGIVGRNETPIGSYVRFDVVDGIEGAFWGQIKGGEIVERLAGVAKAHGVREVHADQRESLMLESEFAKHNLVYTVHDWTGVSKPKAVERARRWFADGEIWLPEHAILRRELLNFEERINASGSFTFGARGSGHDDFVALVLTTALADMADDLPSRATRFIAPRAQSMGPGRGPVDPRWWGRGRIGF